MSGESTSHTLLQAVQHKLELLSLQREQVLRQLAEVDGQIKVVADALGLNPEDISTRPPPPPMPRSRSDKRRSGSMVEFAVNTIADHHEGMTRSELKNIIGAHEEFGPKLKSNMNHFYNFLKRSIDRGEVEEKWGRLWLAGRAPTEQPRFAEAYVLFDQGGGNA